MELQVILLNGPSSSGKSTLAKALRELLSNKGYGSWEVVSIDDFMSMSPTEKIYEDDVFEISNDICRRALELLEAGSCVIIDPVIIGERIFSQLMERLHSYPLRTVHITCLPDILKSRELARGNRCIGSAEALAEHLFPKEGHDPLVDTGSGSAEENVEKFLKYYSDTQNECLRRNAQMTGIAMGPRIC